MFQTLAMHGSGSCSHRVPSLSLHWLVVTSSFLCWDTVPDLSRQRCLANTSNRRRETVAAQAHAAQRLTLHTFRSHGAVHTWHRVPALDKWYGASASWLVPGLWCVCHVSTCHLTRAEVRSFGARTSVARKRPLVLGQKRLCRHSPWAEIRALETWFRSLHLWN